MRDKLMVRIKKIKYNISVALVACRKHDNFTDLRKPFKQFLSKGPYIDSRINFLTSRKLNCQTNIIHNIKCLIAMYKCLIQIKDDGHFVYFRIIVRFFRGGSVKQCGYNCFGLGFAVFFKKFNVCNDWFKCYLYIIRSLEKNDFIKLPM